MLQRNFQHTKTMKTLFIGDIHGRNIWQSITSKEQPDRVVFIGDYFDSFDIPGIEQLHNFKNIIEYKKTSGIEVIMLVGNHDYHYFPGGETYSGFQHTLRFSIYDALNENKEHLQMCYQLDNILCSHAGIGHNWLVTQTGYNPDGETSIVDHVNNLWTFKPNWFMFNGFDPYGDSKTQTPIWIRPASLMSGNKQTFLKTDYIQIAGHTGVRRIDVEGKATGGRYYFIDALEESQYLVYEDGKFSVGVVADDKQSF